MVLPKLQAAINKSLETGKTLETIHKQYEHKGYTSSQIQKALHNIFIERWDHLSPRTIKIVEYMLTRDKSLNTIIEELHSRGHSPFRIEESILYAKTPRNLRVATELINWQRYTRIHLVVLILSFLFGLFYNPAFFLGTLASTASFAYASFRAFKDHNRWQRELDYLPIANLQLTQGPFGYNGLTHNYWRWGPIDPSSGLMVFFFLLGISMSYLFGTTFFGLSAFLGLIAAFGYYSRTDKDHTLR
ncbi:MAG: hypothetical protein ACOCWQ_00805 [Nanoarchaeota archaeon]